MTIPYILCIFMWFTNVYTIHKGYIYTRVKSRLYSHVLLHRNCLSYFVVFYVISAFPKHILVSVSSSIFSSYFYYRIVGISWSALWVGLLTFRCLFFASTDLKEWKQLWYIKYLDFIWFANKAKTRTLRNFSAYGIILQQW